MANNYANNQANGLTHLDAEGKASMVDVSEKQVTARSATAMASITMKPETLALIQENGIKKGDVLAVARIAGILAAKKCSELIPLCHPLALTSIKVEFELLTPECRINILATCKLSDKTGVEMEALTAASISALTVYDMCKAVDKGMVISDIKLLEKTGGKSGTYKAIGQSHRDIQG